MTFVAFAFISCNREEPTPDNPNNSDEFDTYAKIEAYCLDNGWTEKYLSIENYSHDSFEDMNNSMELYYENNGTLRQCRTYVDYKLFSSFSSLLEVNAPPVEGYITSFTCDNEKFGICRVGENPYDVESGYAKFYVRRINSNKVKIFYKKCNWQ